MNNKSRDKNLSLNDIAHIKFGNDIRVFDQIERDGTNCAIWNAAVPQSVAKYFDSLEAEHLIELKKCAARINRNKNDHSLYEQITIIFFQRNGYLSDKFNTQVFDALPQINGVIEAKEFLLGLVEKIKDYLPEGKNLQDLELRFSLANEMNFHIDAVDYRVISTLNSRESETERPSTLILPNHVAQQKIKDLNEGKLLQIEFQNLVFETVREDALSLGNRNIALFSGRSTFNRDVRNVYPLYHASPKRLYSPTNKVRTFIAGSVI